jgi:hypothetical protein
MCCRKKTKTILVIYPPCFKTYNFKGWWLLEMVRYWDRIWYRYDIVMGISTKWPGFFTGDPCKMMAFWNDECRCLLHFESSGEGFPEIPGSVGEAALIAWNLKKRNDLTRSLGSKTMSSETKKTRPGKNMTHACDTLEKIDGI